VPDGVLEFREEHSERWVCSQGIRFWHGLRRRPIAKCGQYRLELANNLRTLSLKPVLLVTVGQYTAAIATSEKPAA
jgi:hypothetical protein